MYESAFGLTGNPFNLNPDPAFYFESRGHGNALAYLKFGVYQSEGFIVVTGDIGTGKTTLVRTLRGELDAEKVVAAQIVSTQLEAGDLLRAVATAFGVSPKGLSKAELISTIEAFLTMLASQGRRALLIVDEAQNLDRTAVEELRMLSNFQLGSHALLQSFLVGQPELRALLGTKSMEQFRQRVIASCHLGPMDADETRRYVLHRLQRVGWTDKPTFDDAAFDAVFRHSGGVPRRINLLCNRVMLSAYLSSREHVDPAAIESVANEIGGELGESTVAFVSADVASGSASDRKPAARVVAPPAREPLPVVRGSRIGGSRRLVLCVSGSTLEDLKSLALLQSLAAAGAPLQAFAARLGSTGDLSRNNSLFEASGLADHSALLDASGVGRDGRFAKVMDRLLPLVQRERPAAIIVSGSSDAALAASLLASRSGCKLLRVEAPWRRGGWSEAEELNCRLVDRQADVIYTSEASTREGLKADGVEDGRVHLVGNLLIDALEAALPHRVAASQILHKLGLDPDALLRGDGFGLVSISESAHLDNASALGEVLKVLQSISREVPLVWPASKATLAAIERHGLRDLIDKSWLSTVDQIDYLEYLGLLGDARLTITDSVQLLEESSALSIPCLSFGARTRRNVAESKDLSVFLGPINASIDRTAWSAVLAARQTAPAKLWDGHAGSRLVDHLRGLLDIPAPESVPVPEAASA